MEVNNMDGLSNKEKKVPVEETKGSTPVVGAENKSIIPRSAKGVQSTLDQFGVEGLVEVKDASESMKDQAWKDKVTPEIVAELKKLKNFSVEVEINGEKQTKTAQDVLEAMGKLGKEGLSFEQKFEAMLEASRIHTALMQEYEAGTEEGEKLRGIFDTEVMGVKGKEVKEGVKEKGKIGNLFERIEKGDTTVINELVEMMGGKFDEKMGKELGGLIKTLFPSEGVEAAPMVTVKDGKIEIVPAPRGEEAGQPTPAPSEGGGISKTPEPSGTPGGNTSGNGEGGNKNKTTTEEEKKKFDWWKYGNGFLFLLILYMGAQGWYAKMWEQMAERAR